jgi:type I restriction-modification system DNA methylase subunit
MSESPSVSGSVEADFTRTLLSEYSDLYAEIETGERAEHDLMPRLVRHLFVDTLGFEETDYEQENDWNDIRFYDQDRNPVLIVEGKRRDVDVTAGLDQVFEYASRTSYVEYLAVTNVDQFQLYRRCEIEDADETRYGVSGKLLADINFEGILNKTNGDSIENDLDLSERQSLQSLMQIRATELQDADRYDEFDIPDREDISTDDGFENLVDSLSKCLDEYLMPYTLTAFDEYREKYDQFRDRADDLERQIDRLRDGNHDDSEIAELEIELGNLESEYEQYREFHSDYQTWVNLSQRQDEDDEDNKRVFCRESVYVQINKILLIRIAEDQGLTNRMISNGGVTQYFDFWDDFGRYTRRDYTDLFEFASEELSEVYDHLYTQQIFDWSLQDGAELDDVIQRTLWHLNHYDFSEVSRDVLGHLYEEHLDPQERKELGEFYTPTSVVDYILDEIGYTTDEPLELDEYDLLDPACGSGTFLVRATKRLRERLDAKGVEPRAALDIIQDRIHGFDLNPFATHIAEMNLLFQVIDLYREVKADDENYTLDRFEVYQTDSLRSETQTSLTTHQSDLLRHKYQAEKRAAHEAKSRDDYRFVVGNPPYVRIQNLPDGPTRAAYDEYYSAYYNYDLYCLFVERSADWLATDGRLGFVVSNKFLQSRYGERLREFIPTKYRLDTLVDFGSIDVFRSAKAFPLILTATRREENGGERSPDEFVLSEDYHFTVVDVSAESFPSLLTAGTLSGWDDVEDDADDIPAESDDGESDPVPTIPEFFETVTPESPGETPPETTAVLEDDGIELDDTTEDPVDVFRVSSNMISDSDWRFVSAREEEAMSEIENAGDKLAEYCVDDAVERGLRTGDNDTFVVDDATIAEYDIEDELVHPLVGGKQVERWYSPWEDRYVVYTRKDTDIDDYPNAKAYLEEHRDDLEDRWCVAEGGEPWYAIDKTKSPELFERPKIVTPDIVLYNNFWLDESAEFYCLNTTYQILSKENIDNWYLLGVLNSEPVQFYYRRTAPTYKDDFLRYISEYLEKIPIPNPDDADSETVETVAQTARKLQDRVSEYHDAAAIERDPTELYDTADVDSASLARTGYLNRVSLDGDDIADIYRDGVTVRLNVHDEIECRNETIAESFCRVLQLFDPDTVAAVEEMSVPRTADALDEFLDAYDATAGSLDAIEAEIVDLETELNDAVYELYGFDDETREFIAETVETPTTPIRPKAMSD